MSACCPHCGKPLPTIRRSGAGLTPRMSELLGFIEAHVAEHDYAPTQQAMADAIGLASRSGVNRMLGQLEERGYIRRMRSRHGAIEIMGQGG